MASLKNDRRYFLNRFAVVTILFTILATTIFFISVRRMRYEQMTLIQTDQKNKIQSEKILLELFLDETVLDLNVITNSSIFQKFFIKKSEKEKDNLEDLVKQLFIYKRNYYQLRFLDTLGMEKIRISRENGKTVIATSDQLQDKSKRDYFKETIKLSKGDIYVSPFDLNIEHEKIEIPYRPMIRICMPVFDDEGKKVGVNVLNYDGNYFMEKFDQYHLSDIGYSYLVNKDSYFLKATDSSLEWGFMFKDKKNINLRTVFPAEAELIMNAENGQLYTENGLFTYSNVYPFESLGGLAYDNYYPKDDFWKILSVIPKRELTLFALLPMDIIIWLYILVLIVGLIFSYFYLRIALRKYHAQNLLVVSENKLQIANASKDRFFSILSHDLRNSSGSIKGYLDLLIQIYADLSAEEMAVHLNDLRKAATHHNDTLNEILEWARAQQGKMDFKPEPINLIEVLNEQVGFIAVAAKNKELELIVDCPEQVMPYADLKMVKTILRNLLSNALKFSHRNNKIILAARQLPNQVEIRVTDFGVGMREENSERVFDITVKIQQYGTEDEPGTGLGLKLVAELVARNNGQIRVESELGKGTSFFVSLPIEK